jgi:hypothetical protein
MLTAGALARVAGATLIVLTLWAAVAWSLS